MKPTPSPGRGLRRCIGDEMILLVLDKYKFFVKTNYLVNSGTRIATVFELIFLNTFLWSSKRLDARGLSTYNHCHHL